MFLPLALITADSVTRAFFWTPHLQMFNIFMPILSVWLLYHLLHLYFALLLYLTVALPFTGLMGFYAERLCFPLSVPRILGIALESRYIYETLGQRQKIAMRAMAFFSTVAYLGFWAVTPGPYG